MQHPRRKFLHLAGVAAGGALVLPHWACQESTASQATAEPAPTAAPQGPPSLSAFGVQLYTLRDVIGDDPRGIIGQVASFGYTQIESYEGPQGMFWGMKPAEFKTFAGDLGLTMVASHCDIHKDFARKAAEAAEAGASYLICPYVGPQKKLDAFKRLAEKFNECGDICQQNGLRFAYHNHAYSFEPLEGVLPQDLMMAETNPDTVDFEMDMYWVVTAGADPVAWLEKYANRFRLCHIKDRLTTAPAGEPDASCVLGTGSIAYPGLLKAAAAQGMQYYLLEQERYDDTTPLDCVKAGAEYLKNLRFG